MYNKDLKDYLNVLRTREPRPPFSEMARLVANAPARSVAAIPLYAKLAGAVAIIGVVASGAWVLSARFHVAAVRHASNPVKYWFFLSGEWVAWALCVQWVLWVIFTEVLSCQKQYFTIYKLHRT